MHIKGQTECYECQPKPAPKSYPVCTITSTPSKVRFPFMSIASSLRLSFPPGLVLLFLNAPGARAL